MLTFTWGQMGKDIGLPLANLEAQEARSDLGGTTLHKPQARTVMPKMPKIITSEADCGSGHHSL